METNNTIIAPYCLSVTIKLMFKAQNKYPKLVSHLLETVMLLQIVNNSPIKNFQ